ncbi:hypothetical protein C8Q78DRAFT_39528 [Trametes maxima]|nr:hypothetical protein C8Q78DRAFT_39528 [Trametes maxima]
MYGAHNLPAAYNQAIDYAAMTMNQQAPAQYLQQQPFNMAPGYGASGYHGLGMPPASIPPQMAIGYGVPGIQYGGPIAPNASRLYVAHPYGAAQSTFNVPGVGYDTVGQYPQGPRFMPTHGTGYMQGPGSHARDQPALTPGHSPIMYPAQAFSPGVAGFAHHAPRGGPQLPPEFQGSPPAAAASTSQANQNSGNASAPNLPAA